MTKCLASTTTFTRMRPQRANCLSQSEDRAYSSYFSTPDTDGETKFLCEVTSNKGLVTKLSRYLDVSPCLSFRDRLQRALLYRWHQSHPGSWEKTPAKIWWIWRMKALLTTYGVTKPRYHKAAVFLLQFKRKRTMFLEQKLYSPFLLLMNCSEVMPEKGKRAL